MPGLTGSGYHQHWLSAGAKKTGILTHHLVALAFVGPAPGNIGRGGWQINHRNGIKTDNRPENLEWCLPRANHLHASDLGLKPRGERLWSAKLSADDVRAIRGRLAKGETLTALGREFGCSIQNIYRIRERLSWRHV